MRCNGFSHFPTAKIRAKPREVLQISRNLAQHLRMKCSIPCAQIAHFALQWPQSRIITFWPKTEAGRLRRDQRLRNGTPPRRRAVFGRKRGPPQKQKGQGPNGPCPFVELCACQSFRRSSYYFILPPPSLWETANTINFGRICCFL